MELLLTMWLCAAFAAGLERVGERWFPRARNPGALAAVMAGGVVFAGVLWRAHPNFLDLVVGLYFVVAMAAFVYLLMAWWFPRKRRH